MREGNDTVGGLCRHADARVTGPKLSKFLEAGFSEILITARDIPRAYRADAVAFPLAQARGARRLIRALWRFLAPMARARPTSSRLSRCCRPGRGLRRAGADDLARRPEALGLEGHRRSCNPCTRPMKSKHGPRRAIRASCASTARPPRRQHLGADRARSVAGPCNGPALDRRGRRAAAVS